MEDVHVYVDRPAGKEDSGLEDLGEALRGLDHVFEVQVDASSNVVAVSYEGARRGERLSSGQSRRLATRFRDSL